MATEETKFTVGKTTFYQGDNQTHPLFRIEPGIPPPKRPRTGL